MTNNNEKSTVEAVREKISGNSSLRVQHSPMPTPERPGTKRSKSTNEKQCALDDVFGLQTEVGGTNGNIGTDGNVTGVGGITGNADSIGTEGNVTTQQQHTVAATAATAAAAGVSTNDNGDVSLNPLAATEVDAATNQGNNGVVVSQRYRTRAQIQTVRNELFPNLNLPNGMPHGPYPTFEQLFIELDKWAKDLSIGGGAFSLIKDARHPATTCRGATQLIRCSCAGCYRKTKSAVSFDKQRPNQKKSIKTDCKWAFFTEQLAEGWMVTHPPKKSIDHASQAVNAGADGTDSFNPNSECVCHNHPLLKNNVEKIMFPGMGEISDELDKIAKTLELAGLPPSSIYRTLVKSCREKGIEKTFNQDYIKNNYGIGELGKILDCTNLQKHLQQRYENDNDLQFDIETDSDGTPEKVFFVLKGGKQVWNHNGSAKVILYDTKHGTNRYGMKLACFTTIDNCGRTQALAATVLSAEDEDHFAWAYAKFQEMFGSAPNVIFTDSDQAMANALGAVWPETVHLLCTFHIWKNFWQHIHPLFINNNAGWRKVADMWWRLCKTSDELGRDSFDDRFDELVQFITETATVAEKCITKQLEWLQSLKDRKWQWAACFTWQHCTRGIHSTQRAEAIHSAIKQFCSKTSLILDMVQDLEQMAEEQSLKSVMDGLDMMVSTTIGNMHTPPAFEEIQSLITPFARKILNAQIAQFVRYQCSVIEDDDSLLSGRFLVCVQCVSTTTMAAGISSDTEARISDYNELQDAADYGMDKNSVAASTHIATTRGCTCQFPLNWGIPCRHMLRVIFNLPPDEQKQCMVSYI